MFRCTPALGGLVGLSDFQGFGSYLYDLIPLLYWKTLDYSIQLHATCLDATLSSKSRPPLEPSDVLIVDVLHGESVPRVNGPNSWRIGLFILRFVVDVFHASIVKFQQILSA